MSSNYSPGRATGRDLALKKGMSVEGRLVTLTITYLICRPLAKTSKAILPNDSK